MASEILNEISLPYELGSQTVRVGASMGMAFFPEDGETRVEIMRRADIAMYSAKQAGKNTCRFFSEDMLEAD